MERFSLHIEKTIEYYQEQGLRLQGIIAFQYPVYCIHSTIKDSTPEKEYQIDLTLLKIIDAIPNIDNDSIHRLTNIPKHTIIKRFEQLIKEGFIEGEITKLLVTQEGKNYIKHGNALRYQFRSYDFFVDGRTLKPLRKGFYTKWRKFLISEKQFHTRRGRDGNVHEEKDFNPDLVFTPLDKEDLMSSILAIETEDRETYSIPKGCEDIDKVSYTQLCFPLMIGLFLKHNGEVVKTLVNGYAAPGDNDDIRDLSRDLSEIISDSVIQIQSNSEHSIVYSKHNLNSLKSVADAPTKIYSFSKTDAIEFIKVRGRISIDSEDSLICSEKAIIFNVDESVIRNNLGKSRTLIRNLIRERDYILSQYTLKGVWLINIGYNSSDLFVEELIELYKELKTARKSRELDTFIRKFIENGTSLEKLTLLQEYDIVENININKHMTLFN